MDARSREGIAQARVDLDISDEMYHTDERGSLTLTSSAIVGVSGDIDGVVVTASAERHGPRATVLSSSAWDYELALPAESVLTVAARDEQGQPLSGIAVRCSVLGADITPIEARTAPQGGFRLARRTVLQRDEWTGRTRRVGAYGDHDQIAVTTALGSARLDGIPHDVRIRVVVRDLERTFELATVTLFEGEHRTLEWMRPQGGTLRGYLFDPRGEPLARLRVVLAAAAPEDCDASLVQSIPVEFASTRTAPDGSFEFDRVPYGRWLVVPGYMLRSPRAVFDASAPACLAALVDVGREVRPEVCVLQTERSEPITGRIVDALGESVPNCRVIARPVGRETAGKSTGYSNKEGYFAIGPILPGEYMLDLIGPSSQTQVLVSTIPSKAKLVLRLP